MITHQPTGVRAEATERRSQAANRLQAIFRLRVNLAVSVRTAPGDQVSNTWKRRCRGGRISINPTHDEFPCLLAEAINALTFFDMDVKQASRRLDCTTSQLTKLLKLEYRALAQVNAARIKRGQKPLS